MNSNDLNNDQLASYYIERLRQCDQSWDELCTSQRQEIARLQQECNNLRLQQTMQRASVAEEISQFCIRLANCAGTNRLGGNTGNSGTTNTNTNTSSSSSSSLRGGSNITSGGRNTAPSTTPLQSLLASRQYNNHQNQNQNQQRNNNNINNNNNNRLIPLRAIIRFLNRYTDGMVMDQTFTQEKRLRDDSAASPILTPAKIPGGGGESQQQQQQQNNNNNNLQHQQNGSSATSSTTTNGRRATGFVYPELQAVQPTSRRHLPEFFDGDEDDFVDDFEEVDLDENDQNNNNIQQQQNQNQQQQQQQQSSTSEASCRGQEYMFQQQQQQRFSGGSNGQLCPDD